MQRTKPAKLSYRCSICQHAQRKEIDRQLVQGTRKSTISETYGVSTAALLNHEREHLSHRIATAVAKRQALENLNLSQEMENLYFKTKDILDDATNRKKPYLALTAIAEARNLCALMSKVALELHQIKIVELELERERDGSAAQDRKDEWGQKLRILTDAELAMFAALREKIEYQTKGVIIPDEDTSPRLSRKEHRQRQEEIEKLKREQEEPEDDGDGELRPGPVEPRTIPG